MRRRTKVGMRRTLRQLEVIPGRIVSRVPLDVSSAARDRVPLRGAPALRASGSGLPVGPAQLVEQERREDADEEGRGEQRQEVRQWAYVSQLARREQTDHAGGRGGERPDDADRQECGCPVATLVLGLSPP